jgi:hypothetical protein
MKINALIQCQVTVFSLISTNDFPQVFIACLLNKSKSFIPAFLVSCSIQSALFFVSLYIYTTVNQPITALGILIIK